MVTLEVTVRSLMKIGPLKTSHVVAGYQKIDNVATGVTIIEAPDIADWLRGGELLLTSLYSASGETFDYTNFIKKLAEKGACALAIKIGRFVEKIPLEIIAAANEFGLPIIELDSNVRFVDIMYPIMEELFNLQVVKLKYYKEVQEKFTTLALQCEGLDSIIRTLEELVNNPVAVFDQNMRCLGTTSPQVEKFRDVPEDIEREILSEKFSIYRRSVCFPANGEEVYTQVVVPIQALSQIKAYLTIAEINRPLQEVDLISVEHAATVVTLDMVKRFAVREVEQKFQNELIENLISGNIASNNTIERARLMGWDLDKPYAVVLFEIENIDGYLACQQKSKNNMFLQSLKSEINGIIVNEAKKRFSTNFIVGNKGDQVILLWPMEADYDKALAAIKQAGKGAQEKVKQKLKKVSLAVGIGEVAADVSEISRSFKEAQDAVTFGQMIFGKEVLIAFGELGIFRILCKFAERNSLMEFVPKPLLKLIKYDEENEADLLKTIEVFLECNGNASKAAKELFIHYKTILYRLERIKEVAGINLEVNENRLELEIGLKIIRLLGKAV